MSVEVLGRRLVKEVEGSGEGFREVSLMIPISLNT